MKRCNDLSNPAEGRRVSAKLGGVPPAQEIMEPTVNASSRRAAIPRGSVERAMVAMEARAAIPKVRPSQAPPGAQMWLWACGGDAETGICDNTSFVARTLPTGDIVTVWCRKCKSRTIRIDIPLPDDIGKTGLRVNCHYCASVEVGLLLSSENEINEIRKVQCSHCHRTISRAKHLAMHSMSECD